MCERETRGRESAHCTYTHTHHMYTHTLTACSLRHGRHGGLTHIQLEHRAGPGPRTRYHGSLSPHKPRPPPPSEFISKKEGFTPWWLSRWKLGSLSHSLGLYYVVTSPPSTTSSPPPPVNGWKMPLIPLCRLGTLLGSKGEGVRHPQPLVYIGPDHEMMELT